MSDIEAENKNLKEEQSEVSAPTEIGAPSVGSKDIRWYVIHTYSGYENKVKDTLTRKVHSMGMMIRSSRSCSLFRMKKKKKMGRQEWLLTKCSLATF